MRELLWVVIMKILTGGGGVIEVRGQWALEQPVIFANKYREREIMRRKDALRMTSKTDL